MNDDLFCIPPYYESLEVTCECPFVNHSCDPNCEYGTHEYRYKLIASSEIEKGEELCIHYGAHDRETSLIAGMQCKCGSSNCVGILKFDFWSDPFFQKKYSHCMTGYILSKIDRLNQEENKGFPSI